MEALLLTLDVFCMVLLLLGVARVARLGDPAKLGVFSYLETKVPAKNQRDARIGKEHA